MSLPLAGGHPDYSNAGSAGKFIPELWSGKLLAKFYNATVFAEISNTDYEGEIKDVGDKVFIRTVPNINISDYSKGMTLAVQKPTSSHVELLIDKGKYFNFILDDVDAHQSDLKLMNDWSNDASEQMKVVVDAQVLDAIPADVAAANKGATAGAKSAAFNLGTTGSAIQVTKANVLDYIVDMGTVLDEANVPETGRWLVVPAWFAGMIKKSDLKDASITGDGTSVLRNGRLGMIDRFTLYSSNQVKTSADTGTKYHVLAGHPKALTFAAQMTKMETLRAESTFGDLVRGLNVYGFKTTDGNLMTELYCYK